MSVVDSQATSVTSVDDDSASKSLRLALSSIDDTLTLPKWEHRFVATDSTRRIRRQPVPTERPPPPPPKKPPPPTTSPPKLKQNNFQRSVTAPIQLKIVKGGGINQGSGIISIED